MRLEEIGSVEGEVEFKGQTLRFVLRLPSFREGLDTLRDIPDTETTEGQLQWLEQERNWLVSHIIDWDLTEGGKKVEVSPEVIDKLPSALVHALFVKAMDLVQKDQVPLGTSPSSDGG